MNRPTKYIAQLSGLWCLSWTRSISISSLILIEVRRPLVSRISSYSFWLLREVAATPVPSDNVTNQFLQFFLRLAIAWCWRSHCILFSYSFKAGVFAALCPAALARSSVFDGHGISDHKRNLVPSASTVCCDSSVYLRYRSTEFLTHLTVSAGNWCKHFDQSDIVRLLMILDCIVSYWVGVEIA